MMEFRSDGFNFIFAEFFKEEYDSFTIGTQALTRTEGETIHSITSRLQVRIGKELAQWSNKQIVY